MKRSVFIFSLLLLTIGFVACGDNEAEQKIIEGSQQNTIVGEWYLMERVRGFSQPVIPAQEDIVCSFGEDGKVIVKNNTKVIYHDLLMDSGNMSYICDSVAHTLTVDNASFGYTIENNLLIISDKEYVDGARYTFKKKAREQ